MGTDVYAPSRPCRGRECGCGVRPGAIVTRRVGNPLSRWKPRFRRYWHRARVDEMVHRAIGRRKEQWLKLLDMADDIRAFIVAHETELKAKD
jgi:hypothetical protein